MVQLSQEVTKLVYICFRHSEAHHCINARAGNTGYRGDVF